MTDLAWKESYNIGVEHLDNQHRKLFATLNKLLSLSKNESKSLWVCTEGIKYLKSHVVEHFADEESYMKSINYDNYDIHKRLHDDFRYNTLPALEKELEDTEGSSDSIQHFLGVCIGWLVAHTTTEDCAITGKVMSKWANLQPEEEMNAIAEVIIQLIDELFRLNSKVISRHYGGEAFGNEIYYRLTYSSQNGERWDISFVLEDKLLIEKVGEMLNVPITKVDNIVVNAARYIFRQFSVRLKECLPSIDLYKLEKESLLTYEQFLKTIDRENPECSLLFDTGRGYFACCINVPDSIHGEIGRSINAQNSIDEIKRYLDNKEHPKKKVLVVDDSSTVRLSMEKLLGTDYQVTLAGSGTSAIKRIMEDKPDLILLDYEMPVCDGRQTLEMIRSEDDMADIPVMFLSGREDKENMDRVMELNAADYLLKTMKPADIKEKIKDYLDSMERPKNKILVVDDSATVRLSMERLLNKDYQIILANSGTSAIKSIMMNKPDLILLDYEMPVCDGRQTLAMIRSEKDIADIPVIFLTGKGDRKSISDVMELKPTGYFLKTMKPLDIKKNIDAFFKRESQKI